MPKFEWIMLKGLSILVLAALSETKSELVKTEALNWAKDVEQTMKEFIAAHKD